MSNESEKIMFQEIMKNIDEFDNGKIDFVKFLEEKINFYSQNNHPQNPIEDYRNYLALVTQKGYYPDFKYMKQYHGLDN